MVQDSSNILPLQSAEQESGLRSPSRPDAPPHSYSEELLGSEHGVVELQSAKRSPYFQDGSHDEMLWNMQQTPPIVPGYDRASRCQYNSPFVQQSLRSRIVPKFTRDILKPAHSTQFHGYKVQMLTRYL
jgi:hypothetical protein